MTDLLEGGEALPQEGDGDELRGEAELGGQGGFQVAEPVFEVAGREQQGGPLDRAHGWRATPLERESKEQFVARGLLHYWSFL
jgi:hypothetical protein